MTATAVRDAHPSRQILVSILRILAYGLLAWAIWIGCNIVAAEIGLMALDADTGRRSITFAFGVMAGIAVMTKWR